jgi:hypothetical protein
VKILTLRARLPDASPTRLHGRVTVLAGLSSDDREALRATFIALTEPVTPALEALLEVHGANVPLDASFAETYGLVDSAPCVIEVPGTEPVGDPTARSVARATGFFGSPTGEAVPGAAAGTGDSNPAAIARLRAKASALRSELTIIERNLVEERAAESQVVSYDARPVESGFAGPSATARELADRLAVALRRRPLADPLELADRLDALAQRRGTAAARSAALTQLMSECRVAIDSVQDAISGGAPAVSSLADALAQIDATRDEMLELASGPMPRKARRRLGELREREAELLRSTRFGSYRELVAAVNASSQHEDAQSIAAARLELLHELEGFWAQRRQQAAADAIEEAELLEQAAEVLGEGPNSSLTPRLAAARLRSQPQPQPQPEPQKQSTSRLLAFRLAAELGFDAAEALTPREVLELAEAELEAAESPLPDGPFASGSGPVGTHGAGSATGAAGPSSRLGGRTGELEAEQRRVREELDRTRARLDALERAAAIVPGSTAQGEAGRAGAVWSLPVELDLRRPMPHVGSMPVLLIEPESGPTSLDQVDVPGIVALAAERQVVWVTDRPEVVSAVEVLGNLAATIIV